VNLARVRKAVTAAVGLAITLVLLVPEDSIPEQWRPWVGLLLAVGTVAGVYRVRNDKPVTREDLMRKVDYYQKPRPPREDDDVAGPPRRHIQGDRPDRPG
jgi:hypothetical protein